MRNVRHRHPSIDFATTSSDATEGERSARDCVCMCVLEDCEQMHIREKRERDGRCDGHRAWLDKTLF